MEEKKAKGSRIVKVLVILILAAVGMLIWRREQGKGEVILNETAIDSESGEIREAEMQEGEKVLAEPERQDKETATDENAEKLIGVHVSGAVRDPDQVYFLPEGSRVFEAIEAAGGAVSEADLTVLNLAEYLVDGEKIHVPLIGELSAEGEEQTKEEWIIYPVKGETGTESSSSSHLTNINEASKIELISLPGIGESLAERIIAYREEIGGFLSIEDIKNVSGIGESKYQMICDLITVD